MVENEILVYCGDFAPYDFNNWRECCNFLWDRVYGLEKATTLIDYKKGCLIIKTPLTGDKLTVQGRETEIEQVHRWFILRNLYRPYTHS